MNLHDFRQARDASIEKFVNDNALLTSIDEGSVNVQDYRGLLSALHYQTLKSPVSFAIAGARCCRQEYSRAVADYLIHHANDENGHHKWLESDAEHVGGMTYCPDTEFPPTASAVYVAFNFYIAEEFPVGRLAIASVLEGLAARVGPRYLPRLMTATGLEEDCFTFFSSHATTDAKHIVEIDEIITGLELSDSDWRWMTFCATTASELYKSIYNSVSATSRVTDSYKTHVGSVEGVGYAS